MSPPLPPQNPGPCCMNDNYEHFMKPQWNGPYVWNAVAGGVSPLIPAIVPQSVPYTNVPYNIIPASGDEFVYGVWNWNLESGALIGPNTYQTPSGIVLPWGQVNSDFGAGSSPGDDKSIWFHGNNTLSWSYQYINFLVSGQVSRASATPSESLSISSKFTFIFDGVFCFTIFSETLISFLAKLK